VQAVGKHFRQGKGQLRKRRPDEPRYARNPVEDWIIRPDSHEPIVSRDRWERVQARLAGNRTLRTPLKAGGPFLLNRLLVCGHCGSAMWGATQANGQPMYTCGGYARFGSARCHRNGVYQQVVIDTLRDVLEEKLLNAEYLQQLRAEVREQEEVEKSPVTLDALRRSIQALDDKIRQGTDAALLAPRDRQALAWERIGQWQEERGRLALELDRLSQTSRVDDLEKRIAMVEALLWQFRDAIQDADPNYLRVVLREMVSKVELRFTHTQGRQCVSHLASGTIYLACGDKLPAVGVPSLSGCRRSRRPGPRAGP
jgi:hypothetical protein